MKAVLAYAQLGRDIGRLATAFGDLFERIGFGLFGVPHGTAYRAKDRRLRGVHPITKHDAEGAHSPGENSAGFRPRIRQ